MTIVEMKKVLKDAGISTKNLSDAQIEENYKRHMQALKDAANDDDDDEDEDDDDDDDAVSGLVADPFAAIAEGRKAQGKTQRIKKVPYDKSIHIAVKAHTSVKEDWVFGEVLKAEKRESANGNIYFNLQIETEDGISYANGSSEYAEGTFVKFKAKTLTAGFWAELDADNKPVVIEVPKGRKMHLASNFGVKRVTKEGLETQILLHNYKKVLAAD